MSETITWLIVALLVMVLSWAVAKGVWSAVAKFRVVLQILLFCILMICVVRVFFTHENLDKLHDRVERTGIGERVEGTIMATLKNNTAATRLPTPPATETDNHQDDAPSVGKQTNDVVEIAEQANKTTIQEKANENVDLTQYDKGRKTYTYALPFGAKVTMCVKDGSYRLLSESIGQLSASDKKEVGKLILKSLSAYRGEEVSLIDKTRVSINVKNDEKSNHTQVFVVVPFDAIER